jgi:hypothetical protein
MVSTAERVFKDIGDNPSRVIFGGAPTEQQPALPPRVLPPPPPVAPTQW